MRFCSLIHFLGLFTVFAGVLSTSACLDQKEEMFNPCTIHQKLEELYPAQQSLSWLYYPEKSFVEFEQAGGARIRFQVSQSMSIEEGLYSSFVIPCPQDSSQTRLVDYHVKEYVYTLDNIDTSSRIQTIALALSVVLDEHNSTLDRPLLADVLTLYVKTRVRGRFQVLQFPVTIRGYDTPVQGGFQNFETLILSGRTFNNVYVNTENESAIKLFYTPDGLIGIESEDGLYLLK